MPTKQNHNELFLVAIAAVLILSAFIIMSFATKEKPEVQGSFTEQLMEQLDKAEDEGGVNEASELQMEADEL